MWVGDNCNKKAAFQISYLFTTPEVNQWAEGSKIEKQKHKIQKIISALKFLV